MTHTRTLTAELDSSGSDTQAIIDAARQGVEPQELELGGYFVVSTPRGVEHIDLTGDKYKKIPDRKVGTVTVADIPSFLHYARRHGDADSEFFASAAKHQVQCVLDAHEGGSEGEPRWQQHELVLQFTLHPVWRTWNNLNTSRMTQAEFAEFLADQRQWIHQPAAADMLEMVQTFQATTKVEFKSGHVVKTGQRQLVYVENTTAGGGNKGTIEIPDEIVLGLPVYAGSEVVERVTARLRYRISEGNLTMWYVLDNVQDVVEGAFRARLEEIQTELQTDAVLQDVIMRVP